MIETIAIILFCIAFILMVLSTVNFIYMNKKTDKIDSISETTKFFLTIKRHSKIAVKLRIALIIIMLTTIYVCYVAKAYISIAIASYLIFISVLTILEQLKVINIINKRIVSITDKKIDG